MKIGKYKLHIIESGYFRLDGGAMFGIIPKLLWERTNPSDDKNRVTLSTRCLLLISDSRKILVDTGMGTKWDEKSKEIYKIEQSENDLINSLSKLSFTPDDITDVFLTHLHFDHVGFSTRYDNGKIVPTFPNAKYFVQKKNFDWGMNPSDRDRGSYIKENFEPLAKEGLLNFLDEKTKHFDDELEIVLANGHTFGQQFLKISDSSNTFFFCGDLIPFASHVHLPFIMAYDLQPLITLQEKKEILLTAVEEDWTLIFEHDPKIPFSKVIKTEKGFKLK
ncbi:MAG: MBL fold metallo-hydrolase [Chlorobiaceae bacterium]|nr:MBL fold metallo-hydrolase [Chlorobiaceae bacterium]